MWSYDKSCGIGIIHYEPIGVFGFVFQPGTIPTEAINFAEGTEVRYWVEHFKKSKITLTYGCQIDKDRGSALVKRIPQGYLIPELNLEIKVKPTGIEFKSDNIFKDFDSPIFEHFECNSVLFNTNKNLVIKEFKPEIVIPPAQQVVPEVKRISHAQETAIITINATTIK